VREKRRTSPWTGKEKRKGDPLTVCFHCSNRSEIESVSPQGFPIPLGPFKKHPALCVLAADILTSLREQRMELCLSGPGTSYRRAHRRTYSPVFLPRFSNHNSRPQWRQTQLTFGTVQSGHVPIMLVKSILMLASFLSRFNVLPFICPMAGDDT
jgi:hypothetical protein